MPGDPEVHDQHEDREEQAAPADEQTTVAWRGLGRRGLLALVAVIVLLTAAVVVEAVVLWRYVGLALWPADLSLFHHHPESATLMSWPAAAAVAGWIALVAVIAVGLRRWPGLAPKASAASSTSLSTSRSPRLVSRITGGMA